MDSLLEETFVMPTNLKENKFDDKDNEEFINEIIRFTKLVYDAHEEVYSGCKTFLKLSIVTY